MQEQNNQETATLYIHLCLDGSIFLLPGDTYHGAWAELPRLHAELTRLQSVDGELLYSIEELEVEATEGFEQALQLINSFDVVPLPVDPHPATNGYRKSYSRYIFEAIDAADYDVVGTEGLLAEAEAQLTQAQAGTKEHRELTVEMASLKVQLKEAQHAYRRLLDLELELCFDAEGGEQ